MQVSSVLKAPPLPQRKLVPRGHPESMQKGKRRKSPSELRSFWEMKEPPSNSNKSISWQNFWLSKFWVSWVLLRYRHRLRGWLPYWSRDWERAWNLPSPQQLKHWKYQSIKVKSRDQKSNINNFETCSLPTGKLEGCIPHWFYDQKATKNKSAMGHDISHNPHPALPKNKGRDAPFGFEATAGWVAMSHPRSCRDRHCSSSPWGFVQKKLLVSLCLAWWWSRNWLRDVLEMLQWSQINGWRGVSGRHHCTTVILILILTIDIMIMHQSVPKVSATAVYLSLLWFEVLCPPPEHNKTILQPTSTHCHQATVTSCWSNICPTWLQWLLPTVLFQRHTQVIAASLAQSWGWLV